jgi:hypothetical protein
VSIVGSNVAQSMAGLSQAERSAVQEKREEAARRVESRSRRAEGDEVIVQTEAAEAARRLAGNDQEEAHEDRQSHAQYAPDGRARQAGQGRLDVEG